MKEIAIVKEYEFIKPEIDEVDYLLDKVIKDCKRKYFRTYKKIDQCIILNLQK